MQTANTPTRSPEIRNGAHAHGPAVTSTPPPSEGEGRGGVTPAPHDLLTRLRDRWGNRLPWGSAFSIPTVADVPLEETPLAGGLRVIEAHTPARAATLHHFYDHKLLDALRRFWHVLAEETDRLDAANADALAYNAALDAQKQALEAERDAATQTDRTALTSLEDGPLADAHADAAEKVARTGGLYDPQDPSDAAVLRHGRRPLDVLAAEMALPGPHGDRHALLPGWVNWLLTGVVGTLVGLSLGLVTHLLEADTLTRHLPLAGACAALGVGLAALAERAVHGAWYRVGQDYYLAVPRSKWGAMIAVAVPISLIVLAVDVCLERQGLLALMQLQADTQALTGHALGRSVGDEIASWIVPLVVTFAYLCVAAHAGYLDGRREEVRQRLTARQDQEWTATDATRRADPAVQAALHALAHVRELLRRRAALQARVAALAAPWDAKTAAAEATRLPERRELEEAARHRIQDALDNFHGAQYAFDRQWEEALESCEPSGGWWGRLLRALTGERPARRTRREERAPRR